mgnify:CR=1 FL=1
MLPGMLRCRYTSENRPRIVGDGPATRAKPLQGSRGGVRDDSRGAKIKASSARRDQARSVNEPRYPLGRTHRTIRGRYGELCITTSYRLLATRGDDKWSYPSRRVSKLLTNEPKVLARWDKIAAAGDRICWYHEEDRIERSGLGCQGIRLVRGDVTIADHRMKYLM